MKSETRTILLWELIGALFIIGFGSILHFTYEWTHFAPVAGFFGAVNESVWEHLKLGFWPLVLFSAVEAAFIGKKVNNYFVAKFLGIVTLETCILVTFYTYTPILKKTILAIDIGSFVLGAILCQLVCFIFYIIKKRLAMANAFSLFGLIIIAGTFMLFTYIPPKLDIFKDKNTGAYGTEWNRGK